MSLKRGSVRDLLYRIGGRLFQAAGAAYENTLWPNFNLIR